MNTIKQVPPDLLRSMGLHKGDFLTVMDESPQGYLIEITKAVNFHELLPNTESGRKAALARFAAGAVVQQHHSQQEMEDARYADLRAKHLK